MYITVDLMSGISTIVYVFEWKPHLFNQKYSKNCERLLQFKITVSYFNTFKM